MRKRLIYILAACLALLASSCMADKGNYKYISLVGPDISGIPESVSVLTHERLRISPEFGADFREDAYLYEWRALSLSNDRSITSICSEADLDYEVSLPAGSYTLYFKLTDRQSGVFWQVSTSLRVSESTSEGWMVLCAEGEQKRTRLDMISSVTGNTYTDILSTEFNEPLSIFWSYYADLNSPFYLLTSQGATRLGRNGFEWTEEYLLEYEMGGSEKPIPQVLCDGVAAKLMVADSKLYYAQCLSSIGLFGVVAPEHNFAPFVGTNIISKLMFVPVFMLYDTDSKSLMGYAPALISPEVGSYPVLNDMNQLLRLLQEDMPNGGVVTGSAYESFPIGYDLVYMENTRYDPNNSSMGMVYTILQEENNYYLYGTQLGELFGTGASVGSCAYAIGKAYYGDLSACTHIADAEHFAFSSLRSKMYYSVGGTVYGVDLTQTPLRSEVEFSLSGEQIRCLKFNIYSQKANEKRSYDLVVGSTVGESGKLRIYEGFNSNGDFASVEPVLYSGLGNIVDVSYREMLD